MHIPPNKLVRRKKYYNEMCKLLMDKHGLDTFGSLIYELADIMEREYIQGAIDVRARRAYGRCW